MGFELVFYKGFGVVCAPIARRSDMDSAVGDGCVDASW